MNWYKKAQNTITMDNIIWAIDKIISEQYEFSVEELFQASQGLQQQEYAMPKAAQTATKRKPKRTGYPQKPSGPKRRSTVWLPKNAPPIDYDILELFERGMSTAQIGEAVGVKTPEVAKRLKKYLPTKWHQDDYLRKKHTKDVLKTTKDLSQKMKKDFNIYGVTREEICQILDIEKRLLIKILTENKIDLRRLAKERQNKIAQNIGLIVQDLPYDFKIKDVMMEFKKRYNFNLKKRSAFSALKLNNLGQKNKDDPKTILQAFKNFINDNITGGKKIFIKYPEKLPIYIDKFFQQYGEKHGFISPMKKADLKKMLMTKIEIRDRTELYNQLGNSPSAYIDQRSLQNKVLNLINQGIPIREIVKQTGLTPNNIRNFYSLYMAKNSPVAVNDSKPSYFLNDYQD